MSIRHGVNSTVSEAVISERINAMGPFLILLDQLVLCERELFVWLRMLNEISDIAVCGEPIEIYKIVYCKSIGVPEAHLATAMGGEVPRIDETLDKFAPQLKLAFLNEPLSKTIGEYPDEY